VVYAEEEAVLRLPARIALTRWEVQHLEVVAVRIAEIERRNATGVLVPRGQRLRAGRRVSDAVRAQGSICTVHVAHDDRDVLKPAVVAARVRRNRTPLRGEELTKLEGLRAERETDYAHACAEHAIDVLVVRALLFPFRGAREAKHVDVEADGAVEIADRHADGVDDDLRSRLEREERQQYRQRDCTNEPTRHGEYSL
jgi:hypothetical protein